MSERSHGFEFSSRLAAPAAEVWAHATSMRGVNRELFPLARMTHPRELSVLEPELVSIGRRAFRSWIFAFGLLPIDYDDLTFVELEWGRRFLERSPMLTQREWQHERVIEPAAGGSLVTDRVRFVPRAPALGPVFLLVFRLTFRLRHWQLRRIFGKRIAMTRTPGAAVLGLVAAFAAVTARADPVALAAPLCGVLKAVGPRTRGLEPEAARAQLVRAVAAAFDYDAEKLKQVRFHFDPETSRTCPEDREMVLRNTRAKTLVEAIE